jgi:uncharacterized membrane protein SirB2
MPYLLYFLVLYFALGFEITSQEQSREQENKADMAWQRLLKLVIFVVEITLHTSQFNFHNEDYEL